MAARLAVTVLLAAVTGSVGTGPCDIYDAASTPCVAAYSTVRALYRDYDGPLYLVNRSSDRATLAINVLTPGGIANSSAQAEFCASTECSILRIFDQSNQSNHLNTAPGGPAYAPNPDRGVKADRYKLTVGGRPVYGAYFEGGMGYRNDAATGTAQGDEPESMYMVVDGHHYNGKCCFDFGNAETNVRDDGPGTMEAVYFGVGGTAGHFPVHKGTGDGPWIEADLEQGLFGGNVTVNPDNTPMKSKYVTAMLKGKADRYCLKGGNAQAGKLKTLYDGERSLGYKKMRKQGAIVLGIGGDNSFHAVGTFLEGVMTAGYASESTDDLVQANIVAAGYSELNQA